MTTMPDEPQDADPTQLEQAGEAIGEAKAAAGRVAKDDSIDTADLPTTKQNVPAAPPDSDSDSDSPDETADSEQAEGAAGGSEYSGESTDGSERSE